MMVNLVKSTIAKWTATISASMHVIVSKNEFVASMVKQKRPPEGHCCPIVFSHKAILI